MKQTVNASDEGGSGGDKAWNGTAWWGFCYHCHAWFGSHNTTCPTLTFHVPSTATNTIMRPLAPPMSMGGTSYTIQVGG